MSLSSVDRTLAEYEVGVENLNLNCWKASAS